MWFLEGQDLATEAVEPSLGGDGEADSEVYWLVYHRN